MENDKQTGGRSVPKPVLAAVGCAAAVLLVLAGALLLRQAQAAGAAQYADITVAGYGTITVALDSTAAPKTVENFVSLAQSGFYDGLTFHRIIEGFMIQGGDPNGDGTGGSGQTVLGEFSANGYSNPLSHTRGAISMARSSDYNSASSQFFLVQEDSTYLDGSYAVFGYVTEGLDIIDAICADAQPTDSNGSIAASEQPVISSIVIR
jgi:peptidyl-prolyl cis-trans isomerase B (cyclophilin B)